MGIYVGFMRGINVGGKNKLPMKELVAIFEGLGVQGVETYIQSGNVLFESTGARARSLAAEAQAAVMEYAGIASPVIIRSAASIRKIAKEHPLGDAGADPKLFAVGLLASKPTAAAVRGLEVDRFLPDRWQVEGSHVYLWYPKGMARTKLTNAVLDRRLGSVSTVRNWNTLSRVVNLCDARG